MAGILQKEPDGGVSWLPKPGDTYLVTGIDRSEKRFSMTFKQWLHARSINVWQGSRWLVRDGKRHLIQRVTN